LTHTEIVDCNGKSWINNAFGLAIKIEILEYIVNKVDLQNEPDVVGLGEVLAASRQATDWAMFLLQDCRQG
jgi:hypothetical protein